MSQIHILLHFQQQGDAPIPSLGTGKLRKGSLTALSGGPQGGDTPRGQRLAAGGALRAEQHHPQEGRGAGALEPPTWGLCSRLALGCRGHRPGGDILISLSLGVRILICFIPRCGCPAPP